jgi:tRNA (guanine26-N2/guanine27-N2)-dimethyltransferase
MTSFKTELISEGTTKILVYKNKDSKKGPGTKKGVPFYNPSMELNRDLSMVFCQWIINKSKKKLRFLDGLGASGIRGIRLAKEIQGDFETIINDWDKEAYKLIKKNIEKNKLKEVRAENKNLNTLLSEEKFDYIDIDPFGSPVGFIDSAMRSIKHGGIIACTATDTATLCGVYPKVCLRRYNAMPSHSVVMKEIALRILLGFLCKNAASYDKGIEPIVSYCTDHYFRIYIRVWNGVNRANQSIGNLGLIKKGETIGFETIDKDVGPLWMGKMQNKRALQELITVLFKMNLNTKNMLWKLLDLLEEESDSPCFFYTIDSLSSFLKKSPPKTKKIFEKLKQDGFKVTRTHFNPMGFKTDAPLEKIIELFS